MNIQSSTDTTTVHNPADVARITRLEEQIAVLEKANHEGILLYHILLAQHSEIMAKYDALYCLAAKLAIHAPGDQQLDAQLADVSHRLYQMVVHWRAQETHA